MLLLLPGLDGTGKLFEPFLRCLREGTATTVVEYPPDARLTYEQLETHVIQRLTSGQELTIIAESFSGPIALKLASRADLNIRAVVLVCSFAYRPLGWMGHLIALLPLRLILRIRVPEWIIRRYLIGADAPDELMAVTRAAIASVNAAVIAARIRLALAADCSTPLKRNARVIALASKHDRLLGRTALNSILNTCPVTEIRHLNTPHFALQTAPAEVLRALADLQILES